VKTARWLLACPFLLFLLLLLAGVVAACGDDPLYACPDPSMPCFPPDAGPDAAGDAGAGD
jgi:hypothetical protein